MHSDWLKALLGGALIGCSSILLMLANGRIFGVSGILGGVLSPSKGDWLWRFHVIVGLVLGGILLMWVYPDAFDQAPSRNLAASIIAGLLVGWGTRMGHGCTSGHGICGISRFSLRSVVATIVFLATGMLTATLMGWLGGAP